MAKKVLEVTDFTGGLNCYKDARDIKDGEFAQTWNANSSISGRLKAGGTLFESIRNLPHDNSNQEFGYGLFTTGVDYSISLIDGEFDNAFEQGTVASYADSHSGSPFSGQPVVELAVASTHVAYGSHDDDDYYKNYCIFIDSGNGIGQTRRIVEYDGSSKKAQLDAVFGTDPNSSSTYKIFKWVGDGTQFGDSGATNYIDTSGDDYVHFNIDNPNGYFLKTKVTSIGNNESKLLGFVTYNPETDSTFTANDTDSTVIGATTLKSGVEYILSFWCRASNRYYGYVADGLNSERVPFIQLYSNTVTDGTNTALHLFQSNSGPVFMSGVDSTYNYADGLTDDDNVIGRSFVTNGDFEDGAATAGTDHAVNGANDPPTSWKGYDNASTTLTTSYEQTNEFGGEGNTLDIESASFDWLVSPDGNVPTCFIYQELTLNDNQWYELFFAYSSASNGLAYAIIDAADLTSSGAVINYGSGYAANSGSIAVVLDDVATNTAANLLNRMLFDEDGNFIGIVSAVGSTTAITFGGGVSHTLDDDDVLYYANSIINWEIAQDTGGLTTYKYIGEIEGNGVPQPHKFFVPKSSTPGTDRKILLCFAPVKTTINVRLDGITVRKSFPDLVSMSNDISGNVYKYAGWANYQLRFTIGADYNNATDWVLRLNAGSYGYQSGASIDSVSSVDSHIVNFGGIRLESVGNDNLLFLNDNTSTNSKISIYSYNSKNWIENDLVWGGLNMKPVYNYINGILKISDANFESGNLSKIFYYLNRKQLGGNYNITGYRTRDLPLSTPPPLIVASSADSQEVVQTFDALHYINTYTFGTSFNEWYGSTPTETNWPAGKLDTMGKIMYYQIDADGASSGNVSLQLHVPGTNNQLTEIDNSAGGHNSPFYLPWAGDDGSANDMASAMTSYTSGDVKKVEITFTYEFTATDWGFDTGNAGSGSGQAKLKDSRHPRFSIHVGKMATDPFNGALINAVDDDKRKKIMQRDPETVTWVNEQKATLYVDNEVWDDTYDETNHVKWKDSIHWPFVEVQTSSSGSHSTGVRYGTKEFKAVVEFEEGKIAIDDAPILKLFSIYPDGNTSKPTNLFDCITFNEDRTHNEWWFTRKERVIFHSIKVFFYDNNWAATDEGITVANVNDTKVTFKFGTPSGQTAVGWEERIFKIGVSSVNIFDEESNINVSDVSVGTATSTGAETNVSSITVGQCPNISVYVGKTVAEDNFRKKLKFYMKDTESNIWYLQFYVDLDENRIYSTTSNFDTTGVKDTTNKCYSYTIPKEKILNYNEVDSYESETLISQDIADKSIQEFICDYKASVVGNNRLYVGNIRQNGKVYGDRIIKSPIGKYNILPATNFIDVAINDGDEIIALEFFKDKLLQFKKHKVFVINTSGDYEFLEDTYEDVGILLPCQVTKTPHGVAWINPRGCYLYDGSKMVNLIDGKLANNPDDSVITNNYWNFLYSGVGVLLTDEQQILAQSGEIGYNNVTKDLVIRKYLGSHANNTVGATITAVPDGYIYNIPTKSWYFTNRGFNGRWLDTYSGIASNFNIDKDGNLIQYVRNTNTSSVGHKLNDILKWDSSKANDVDILTQRGISTTNRRFFYFTTKDFTFGDVTRRKKIYKVYITYKSVDKDGSAAHSYIIVKHATNGGTSFTVFDDSSTNYAASTGLASSANWATAILIPTSSINNVYSMQLQFVNEGSPGYPAVGFEINDISIVYRDKPVK